MKQNLYDYTFISEVGHFQELIEMFKDHASEIVLIPGRETDVTDVQKKQRNHIKLVRMYLTHLRSMLHLYRNQYIYLNDILVDRFLCE